jgi:Fanconi anemia group M protein
MAKGTRDEAYYWISDRKEKTMNRQMQSLSGQTSESLTREFKPCQLQITDELVRVDESPGVSQAVVQATGQMEGQRQEYEPGRIYVDPRERGMAKLLEARGMEVTLRNLDVGDYVVSDRVAIERKTAADFVASIIDPERNLFRQIGDLSRSYDRPVLILEGRDLYTRQVNPSSIRGALAAVAVDYGVPIIPTEDQDETASVIALLATREQKEGHEPKVHGHKTARTLKEQQEYLVSAIPSVGPRVARNLLKHFGSIEKIMIARQEELQEVEMVGPKIAERIRELAGGEYKG